MISSEYGTAARDRAISVLRANGFIARTPSELQLDESLAAATRLGVPVIVLDEQDLRRVLRVERLQLDLNQGRVKLRNRDLPLTRMEALVLACLMRHAGQVVERNVLYHDVWKDGSPAHDGCLGVYIHMLRLKLERNPARPRLIQTIRRWGYRLAPEAAKFA